MNNKVIVITGPTATGKTRLAVEVARLVGGEIVGADSMQIYKYLDIGTAKPDSAERGGIAHHMIDVADPFDDWSVSRYVEEASVCCDGILDRGRVPIITGGTGLYIESLLSGRDFAPMGGGTELRRELESEYDRVGGDEMLTKLSEFDPQSAQKLHANDKKRVVRAFEVYRSTGKTITEHDRESKLLPPRYESSRWALTFRDRSRLYERIDRRVDIMLEQGLVDEVKSLLEMGLPERSTAMQAIGYKEIVSALKGECTLDEAAENVKRESRRYAKRQLSWLRRDSGLNWIVWEQEPDFMTAARRISTVFTAD